MLVFDLFRGFRAVFFKETLHVRRDPSTLFFSLVIPLLQMVVLGFGIDTNIRQVNTVIFNADGRRESRELIDRLKNSDTFYIIRYVQNDRDMNDLIVAGKARVGIKVPVEYSDRLLHQMSAQVLVLIDGSDSSVAGQAINVSNAIGLDESLRRVLPDRDKMAVEMRPKMLFNPDSRSPNFFLPGLTAIMLLNVTTFLTAFSIVREKERGTLEQLFVTPVRPFGLLLGKLLPYLGVGFFELCLILTCMRFLFSVPIHGSVLLLAFLSLPYLFAALSLAIATLIGAAAAHLLKGRLDAERYEVLQTAVQYQVFHSLGLLALAQLLDRIETDPGFLAGLRRAVARRSSLFRPEREILGWRKLLQEVRQRS